jgi:monoamine oxidase
MEKDEGCDVIVVGGGIAGLGAVRELARNGLRVIVLEARNRLGGRIFSRRLPGTTQPVELGAEFVHGNNPELRALLRRAGTHLKPVSRDMYWLHDGELVQARDFWKRTAEIMKRIPAGTRRSFADFLDKEGSAVSPDERRRVRDHVQSFNAAPATRMSAKVLSADHAGADQPQYRPRGGFGRLIGLLERELRALSVDVLLETEVRAVRWTKGAVEVVAHSAKKSAPRTYRAAAVVVTLPLGVLKAKTVVFSPRLKAKEALVRRLGWGDVSRITLRFDPAFFRRKIVTSTTVAKRPADFQFINAPGRPFPVWWVPSAAPFAVGWAGGPLARPLLSRPHSGRVTDALRSLSVIWGVPQKTLRAHLRGAWSHDWSTDAFARGAYSYAAAGVETGPGQLAEPVADTLFFAGEATAEELGTVHGALASGIEAARKAKSAVKRAQKTNTRRGAGRRRSNKRRTRR